MSPSPDDAMTQSGGWRRSFWSLIVTQFQGAFSDNALRFLVLALILGMGLSEAQRDWLLPTVTAIFSLPFILFSMLGGFLADRFSKRDVMIGVKVFEIGVMLAAGAGLVFAYTPLLLAAVFLMGVHSAIFGPSKYGMLPELLPHSRLSWGNGVLELGTFLAIILGTGLGPVLEVHFHGRQQFSAALLVALAVAGLVASIGISRTPAANPQRKFRANFAAEVFEEARYAYGDRELWLALLGNTYFFFIATLLQQNLLVFGSSTLHVNEERIGALQVALGLGIGFGSLAAGYLSGGKIEYGLVPLGSVGMTLLALILAFPNLGFVGVLMALGGLGFFGGFFIVPVNALMQHRPDEKRKGTFLAAANLLSFIGVFAASIVYYLLVSRLRLPQVKFRLPHLDPRAIFLLGGVLTLAATIYCLKLLPQAFARLLLWMGTRTIYRIQVRGGDNIPVKGGALLVCNHLSFVDALLLTASTDRLIRFIMFQDIYEHPFIKPLAKLGQAIPISSQLRPRDMIRALREAAEGINKGHLVCIFAEGQITRIGQMLPFRRGMERIMKSVTPEAHASIIPVHLDGVWGSIFSFERGRFLWKWPREVPYRVVVSFGKPLPPDSPPFAVRQAVQELHTEAYEHHRTRLKPVHRGFVHTARRHPHRFAMADGMTPKVTFGAALGRTVY
ncbi:MAG TPA: MFS transporter, partial [Terriglobales bacterium]|nr:MFS transporter [Terriglobales bacterium]